MEQLSVWKREKAACHKQISTQITGKETGFLFHPLSPILSFFPCGCAKYVWCFFQHPVNKKNYAINVWILHCNQVISDGNFFSIVYYFIKHKTKIFHLQIVVRKRDLFPKLEFGVCVFFSSFWNYRWKETLSLKNTSLSITEKLKIRNKKWSMAEGTGDPKTVCEDDDISSPDLCCHWNRAH